MANFLIPQSDKDRRRLKVLYHITFALLTLHFLLYYSTDWLDKKYTQQAFGFARNSRNQFASPMAKITMRGNKKFLAGGPKESDHFDISNMALDAMNFHYGLGREAFAALIKPEFETVEAAKKWMPPKARVLIVKIKNEIKVYPIATLTRHEVVNDVVGGKPIFASYCILANLGAVYDRKVKDHTLTFALSGYTYFHPDVWEGSDAFVMWDRETESLWWPPVGKAISGPLKDTPLKLLDKKYWIQSTFAQVIEKYPKAMILKSGQDMERPKSWPRWDVSQSTAQTQVATTQASLSQPTPSASSIHTTTQASSDSNSSPKTSHTKKAKNAAIAPPTEVAPHWKDNDHF